ncbi:hypothetical protein [Streptomyces sp. M41(2017)]|uniref:hypothetical protein n=1 Tax=Streptomyces sp. M41(2017) TaxID=1955065 RepID=UPI00117EAAE0|nr:hypothetical protein [Streptomyces sp. M41(2017)]
MAVPNAIRWVDIDPAKIEDVIAVLISRLHPETQRIDGSGGDGGRDVQLPLDSGLVIYEIKSFTGRLNDSRRRQIKRSLRAASSHNPRHWHLIMPLDLTPNELEWYNDLKDDYPFVSNFTRGRTWLDSEMALRPEIARYYIGDSNSEIVNYLRDISREEAVLANGFPDAVARIKRLILQLNEIDPHYVFGFHVDPEGNVKPEVRPRYAGAELDRPFVIKAVFVFPETPEGRAAKAGFRDALDYGVPAELPEEFVKSVEIDAPAGMGGKWSGGTFFLESVAEPGSEGVRYSAVVADGQGRPLAAIPLILARRFRGEKGAQVEFNDMTNFFTIRSRLNVLEKTAVHTFSFEHRGGVLPSALLPTLRFLVNIKVGNQWGLAVNDEVTQLNLLTDSFISDLADYGRYISVLAKLQEYTGFSFPIPDILSPEDGERLKRANYLISGKDLVSKWDHARITFTREGVERWRVTTGSGPGQILMREDFYTEICGNRIYVGQVQKHIASVKADELPDTGGASDEDTFPVDLSPAGDATMTTKLLPREEEF